MPHHDTNIRAATSEDADALARLAALEGRPYRPGPALVADAGGRPVAAIELTSGAVLSDPDRSRASTIRSLRFRRYQLLRQSGDVGVARTLLRRLAPAT